MTNIDFDNYPTSRFSRLTLAESKNQSHYHYADSDFSYVAYSNKYTNFSTIFHPASGLDSTGKHVDVLSDYFTALSSVQNIPFDSGLLPVGLKYLGKNYLIFERPPVVKNIFYVDQSKSNVPDEYEDYHKVFAIPIPWQLYFVKFNQDMYVYEVRMFFMKSSITSIDQELYLPPIPNFYTNGMLCPPVMDNMEDIDRYSKDAAGVMRAAYDWVWNSGTNHDLTEACLHLYWQLRDENTVLKYMDKDYLNAYFPKLSLHGNAYYLSPQQISLIFKSWEKSNLKEVCELSWPNIAGLSQYFPNRHRYRESDSYTDHLVDFILSDGEDYSDEDIEIIIGEGQYDQDAYDAWLIDNNLIVVNQTPPWAHVYTYSELMPQLIESVNSEIGNSFADLNTDINKVISSINKMQSIV